MDQRIVQNVSVINLISIKTNICHYLAVTDALNAPGKIPGSSGTRNLHDNLSDLKAQVAANQKVRNQQIIMHARLSILF